MKRRSFLASSIGLAPLAAGAFTAIQAESPIEDGAKIECLASGFVFLEGPVAAPDGSIYLCEFRNDEVYLLSTDGEVRLLTDDSGGISGLFYAPDGRLIAAGSRARAVFELHPNGTKTVIAETWGGRRFNAPNDIWVSPPGDIYFSDPDWGRHDSEYGGGHVFCISADGRIFAAVEDFERPNGVVGDPALNRLYVIDRGSMQTYYFPIGPDGAVGDKVLFAECGRDGLTVDTAGNVYLTDEEVFIFDKNGRPAGILRVPERPTNACFAGPDKRTLIVTAETGVYAVRTKVPGY